MAQVANLKGPTLVPLDTGVQPNVYTLQSEVGCPTPTFRVGGFAGNSNDWANNDVPYASSSSGAGNYGIAAGFSFPLGRELSDFCKEYAKQRKLYEQQRVRNMTMNSQYSLFRYCRVLVDSGLGSIGKEVKDDATLFDDPAFSEDGPLSSFKNCRPLYSLLRDRDANRVFPDIKDPPKASTQPMSEPAQRVLIDNRPQ
jgi:hypothetical protein